MRKLGLQILLLVLIMRCQSQDNVIVNVDFFTQINDNDRFSNIFYSQNKLFLISKSGIISSIDIYGEKKLKRRFDAMHSSPGPSLPSLIHISEKSIFIAFRKKIVYGELTDSLNFRELSNKGLVKSLRYTNDSLFLFFRDKITITNSSGIVSDSIMLKLDFDGIEGVESPYINFYLSNNQYTLVPFNSKRSEDIDKIEKDIKTKLKKYKILLYPADLNKGFVPKTISSKYIYWQNVKKPHQFIMTSIMDFSKFKLVELDRKEISFDEILPEKVQLSEGDDGTLDLENSVQLTNDDKGNIFIMFYTKDRKTKIYSFKVNENF